MKCKVVRHHLLASEKPARPQAVVAEHLAQCPACQAWQRQLARIERLVPQLYVPPSSGKVDCVREVIHGESYQRNGKAEVEWQRRERALRKVAVTFAMAAGLLFFALCWYAWQHQRDADMADFGSPRRSEIERIADRYDPGWKAGTPRDRVARLAKVVDGLHDQMCQRARAGTVNDLPTLAHEYEVLVRDGILAHARDLPVEDRSEELLGKIAQQLSHAESQARRLATEYPRATTPLDHVAVAAHNGHIELRKLMDAKV
jgi:hypothetical protein